MVRADSNRAERLSGRAAAVMAIIAGTMAQGWGVVLAARSAVDPSAAGLAGVPHSPAVDASVSQANTHLLLACFAWLALASLLIAAGSARLFPPRYRMPRRPLFAYLWILNFAVPFGGLACTLGAFALAAMMPHARREFPFEHSREPEFAAELIAVSYGRGARLKAELQNSDASTSQRMTALLAMQAMPARKVSPLLHHMLADPLDDIRLLAYGILDGREKELTNRILAERTKLDGKGGPALTGEARARVNKALAELYSELLYQNLITGDVYRNAAEQADAYAAAALEAEPLDASLWRLRGRLALDRRDLDAAGPMLQRAVDCGFPRERIVPYLAEAEYLRRDYARVRELVGEADMRSAPAAMRPMLDFWGLSAAPSGRSDPDSAVR